MLIYVKSNKAKSNYLFLVAQTKNHYLMILSKIEIGISKKIIPPQLKKLIG